VRGFVVTAVSASRTSSSNPTPSNERCCGAPRMSACGVHFTEMCSGSEAGSYLRRIDLVYHSTVGLRVIKERSAGDQTRPLVNQTSIRRQVGG